MEGASKLLVAKDLYKNYGPIPVLKGVSLDISRGELVSIVGASGAGKSTLLYVASSLEKADKGSLYFEGQDIAQLNNKALAKYRNEHIGFVFQFHHLLPEFTAIENICIPGWIAKRAKKELDKKAMELLDFMGLADKASKKPNSLSGGEQQRVAVARALINDPHLIFADEPTGNLDSENAYALHELFIQLRDTMNQSFLIVTHNEDLADRCNRKLTMKDGKIIL
ncbi:MAG: ABC transporter ATP-binding protein [Sediminibacterium sp.]|jgi:lipoprotein-releasing system ATP-binding protein|nr:ABC transporter ATP-binding protein [Sediminibacterium sp.]